MSFTAIIRKALVSVGSQVRAPIALVSGGQADLLLYFEIRRQGQAVNPQPWLGRCFVSISRRNVSYCRPVGALPRTAGKLKHRH